MPEIALPDADATARLGAAIAPLLAPGEAVLLYGPLGMGKSTLARGLIRAVTRPDEDVPSPTFTYTTTLSPQSGLWPCAVAEASSITAELRGCL